MIKIRQHKARLAYLWWMYMYRGKTMYVVCTRCEINNREPPHFVLSSMNWDGSSQSHTHFHWVFAITSYVSEYIMSKFEVPHLFTYKACKVANYMPIIIYKSITFLSVLNDWLLFWTNVFWTNVQLQIWLWQVFWDESYKSITIKWESIVAEQKNKLFIN